MNTSLTLTAILTLCSWPVQSAPPEGRKLPLVCVSEYKLVAAETLKGVDVWQGRGILNSLTVTKERRGRIVVSGSIVSDNNGLPKQGSMVFMGDASKEKSDLYALSDCDGQFRFRISSEQLGEKLYLCERGPDRLMEYALPEPISGDKKEEGPNKGINADK